MKAPFIASSAVKGAFMYFEDQQATTPPWPIGAIGTLVPKAPGPAPSGAAFSRL